VLDRYRLASGAFATFTGTRFRVGHVRDPYQVWEVNRDVLKFLVQFAHPVDPDMLLDELRLASDVRQVLTNFVADLRQSGILCLDGDCSWEPEIANLKHAEYELTRATNLVPDITSRWPDFWHVWDKCKEFTLTSPVLGFSLWNACRYVATASIPGAVVECGVWRGGSMMLAAITFLELEQPRNLYLYDTFDWRWEGANRMDAFVRTRPEGQSQTGSDDFAQEVEQLSSGVSADAVRERIVGLGYPPEKVICIPGLVQETVPETLPDEIALLRLDTDYYESTLHELVHLYPRLSVGGVLFLDDYGKLAGATQAVDDYLSDSGANILLNRIDVQGRVGVRIN